MDKAALKEAGILYDEGVNRFSGYNALYEKHVRKFVNDAVFPGLMESMEKNDYEAAFQAAHALKSITGNLSFQTLYEKIQVLVEALRGQADIPLAVKIYPDLVEEYGNVIKAIKEQFD